MAEISISDDLLERLQQEAQQRNMSIEAFLDEQLVNANESIPETMLSNSTDYLALVTEAAHLGIWTVDLATNYLEWNDELLKIYGITRFQFENELDSWRNSVHPDDREEADNRLQEAIRGERVFDVPFRIVRPDGEIRYINAAATPIFDDDGTVIRVIGSNIDVTDWHLAQDKIFSQAQILDTITEAVIILDTSFNIVSWNKHAETLYGWSLEEVIGKSLVDVIPTTYLDSTPEEVIQTFMMDGTWMGDVIHKTKDQEEIFVLSSVSTQYSPDGKPIAYIGINRDITARKHAEELQSEHQLMALRLQQEKEITRIRSQMLRTIAHEFRTPLAVILTSVEMITQYADQLSEQARQRHFEKITRQVGLLDSFIEEMRTFALAEHQFLTGTMEMIDFQAFCRTLLDDIKPILKEGQSIEANISDLRTAVECDPQLIQIALSNLISNAIKYSPTDSVIKFTTTQEQETLEVIIADRGIGIPEEDQPYLFEPFKRASNVSDYRGTGIGLSIVKEAIDKHQGTIDYVSEMGHGTQFVVQIPLRQSEALLS